MTRRRTTSAGRSELIRVAWHEAGHALVGYLEFGNPGEVTIAPTADTLGSSATGFPGGQTWGDWRDTRPCLAEERCRASLRHALAGQAAESVLQRGRGPHRIRPDPEITDAIEAFDWSQSGRDWYHAE